MPDVHHSMYSEVNKTYSQAACEIKKSYKLVYAFILKSGKKQSGKLLSAVSLTVDSEESRLKIPQKCKKRKVAGKNQKKKNIQYLHQSCNKKGCISQKIYIPNKANGANVHVVLMLCSHQAWKCAFE